MYNYGDSVLVIEKDTDENFYVENLKWAYPTKITLSKTSATIKVGESLSLKATSDSVLDISFTWSSNNNSVASVTKDGKVYGNKAGSATITVKSKNGITAACKVTVQNKYFGKRLLHMVIGCKIKSYRKQRQNAYKG